MTKCHSCGHEERTVDDDIEAYFAAYDKCKASSDPMDQYFARRVEEDIERALRPSLWHRPGKDKMVRWSFF